MEIIAYPRLYSNANLEKGVGKVVRWGEDCILLGGVFRNRRLHWSVGGFSVGVMQ